MRLWRPAGLCAAAILSVAAPVAASAAPLTIVTAKADEIACLFNTSCKITVTESVVEIPMPNLIRGGARLHTRTFTGAPGSPAAGKVGYQYRLDLVQAVGSMSAPCINMFKLYFGPAIKFEYSKGGANAAIYVVTSGGPGTIAVTKAEQFGVGINFMFRTPVCAGTGPGGGQSSFLFGLTGEKPPKIMNAQVQADGKLTNVPTRVPTD